MRSNNLTLFFVAYFYRYAVAKKYINIFFVAVAVIVVRTHSFRYVCKNG